MPRCYVDIETDGGALAGNIEYLWSVAVVYEDGTGVTTTDLDFVQDACKKYRPTFHNAAFDVSILRTLGLDIPVFDDTIIAGYVWYPGIEPNEGGVHSLNAWSIRLGERKIDYRRELINLGLMRGDAPPLHEFSPDVLLNNEAALEVLRRYNIHDARLTRKLWKHLHKELKTDERAWQLYNTIELPFVEVVMSMKYNGVLIDKLRCAELYQECLKGQIRAEKECVRIVGKAPGQRRTYKTRHTDKEDKGEAVLIEIKDNQYVYELYQDFNPGSPKQKLYALSKLYGWQPTRSTKRGNPTVDSDALEEMPHEWELPSALLEYSEWSKLFSSFAFPIYNQIVRGGADRLHPNWNQTVTLTGRTSCSSPNFQQIPKRTERGKKFRELVVPEDGYTIAAIDGSQVQLRVLAWYMKMYLGDKFPDANDAWNAFVRGEDIHQANANTYGVERSPGKNITYARIFSASAPRLARMLKMSVEDTQALLDSVNEKNPAFPVFFNMVIKQAKKNGGVLHTMYGRRLVYPNLNSKFKFVRLRAERQAFNALIQGGEADIMKLLAVQSLELCHQYGARLLLFVHDELVFEVPDETHIKEGFKRDIESLFNSEELLPGLPFGGELEYAPNWGEAH